MHRQLWLIITCLMGFVFASHGTTNELHPLNLMKLVSTIYFCLCLVLDLLDCSSDTGVLQHFIFLSPLQLFTKQDGCIESVIGLWLLGMICCVAQWKNVYLWPANFPCFALDLQLMCSNVLLFLTCCLVITLGMQHNMVDFASGSIVRSISISRYTCFAPFNVYECGFCLVCCAEQTEWL